VITYTLALLQKQDFTSIWIVFSLNIVVKMNINRMDFDKSELVCERLSGTRPARLTRGSRLTHSITLKLTMRVLGFVTLATVLFRIAGISPCSFVEQIVHERTI
jgi:hypothetical protein